MRLLAIDPGVKGALAILDTDTGVLEVMDMPVVAGAVEPVQLAAIFFVWRPDRAIIEKVASRPGQGVASVFSFGASYGAALGVIAALKIPLARVSPSTWKAHHGLSADKEKSRAMAIATWPGEFERFKRKMDEGRAEAALLALYLDHQIKANRL